VPPLPKLPPPSRQRWKRIPLPAALEREYARALLSVVDKEWARLRSALARYLPPEGHEDAGEEPAPFAPGELIAAFPEGSPMSPAAASSLASTIASQATASHGRYFRRQFKEALGVEVREVKLSLARTTNAFVQSNVSLIRRLTEEAKQGLARDMTAMVNEGIQPRQLEKLLRQRYEVTARHAQFIAQDQMSKVYANLSQVRHQALGIEEYVWSTMRDGKVRARHQHREGKRFRYDTPPHEEAVDGHAGVPPRCRCWQRPYVTDLSALLA